MIQKEKLEEAKMLYKDANADQRYVLEQLFPELKESEDEKIRKALLDYFDDANKADQNPIYGIHTDKIIAWLAYLEKKRYSEYELENEYWRGYNDAKCHLEKQGEKKPKVTPKFKVGDTIWKKDDHSHKFIILGFDDCYYYGNGCNAYIDDEEWELVEQKPVIEMKSAEESLGIDSDTYNKIVGECVYELEEQEPAWSEANLPEFESYLCLMFQKFRTKGMCTNGEIIDYVKEHSQKLKDILVKLAWSEEDERMYRGLHNLIYSTPYCDSRKELSDWLKSLKDRVQPKPKWSEEDEIILSNIIDCIVKLPVFFESIEINGEDKTSKEFISKATNWLKSLKPQNTWKPSDEQVKVLITICSKEILSEYERGMLVGLYTELQKLREE